MEFVILFFFFEQQAILLMGQIGNEIQHPPKPPDNEEWNRPLITTLNLTRRKDKQLHYETREMKNTPK